jgi:CopG family nickel-responsive transcriptional regulator
MCCSILALSSFPDGAWEQGGVNRLPKSSGRARAEYKNPSSEAVPGNWAKDVENRKRIDSKESSGKKQFIMAELTRISISLESALLSAFDANITMRGYTTRSEAIRDLIRAHLIREEPIDARDGPAEQVVAVVTLVYDHHARELAARLIDKQHHHHNLVVSGLHVHLGERHCLEVSVLRGPSAEVRHLGEELLSTRGVLHGDIIYTRGEDAFSRWH